LEGLSVSLSERLSRLELLCDARTAGDLAVIRTQLARAEGKLLGGRRDVRRELKGIDWLICGGESGPHYRPMRIEWARELRDAAIAGGTAFFFKQWGGVRPKAGGRELDGRTWDELPRRSEGAMPHTVGVAGPNQKQGR
jgi:protein gp37